MKTKICPVCGHYMLDSDTTCRWCERKAKIAAMRTCPVCGHKMLDSETTCHVCEWRAKIAAMKTCPVCGHKMLDSETTCRVCEWRANREKNLILGENVVEERSINKKDYISERNDQIEDNNIEMKKVLLEENDSLKESTIDNENIGDTENVVEEGTFTEEDNLTEEMVVTEEKGSEEKGIILEKNILIKESSIVDRDIDGTKSVIEESAVAAKDYVPEEDHIVEEDHVAEEEHMAEEDHVAEEDHMAEEDHVAEEDHMAEEDHVDQEDHIEEHITDELDTIVENVEIKENTMDDESIEDVDSELVKYQEGQISELETDQGNTFFFELSNDWNLKDGNVFLSADQKEKAYRLLSDIHEIQRVAPSLYGIISNMAKEDNVLIAKLDQYTERLVKEGKLWFSVDKTGEILPTIRNKKHIVKQVRLEEWKKEPALGNPQYVSNIYMQLTLAKILDEVTILNGTVNSIRAELQNDRLAKADSAISLYRQAIASNKLRREEQLKIAATSATTAKTVLIRDFETKLNYIVSNVDQDLVDRFFDQKGDSQLESDATDAMNDLVSILQMVDIECSVHRYFGEEQAIQECLSQYLDFAQRNNLYSRNILLKISGCLSRPLDNTIESYRKLTSNIYVYQNEKSYIEQKNFKQYTITSLNRPDKYKICKYCKRELPSNSRTDVCEYCARRTNKDIKKAGKAIAGVGGILGTIAIGKNLIDK